VSPHGPERPGETEAFARPDGDPVCAVLVLSGSSGRIESERVSLLAAHGAAALSPRWFGGPGQPPGICEVALETFAPALERLAACHDRLAVLGVSKGAEAALLLAACDPRIRAVAALSPTSVAWANVGPGRDGRTAPYRSSWTAGGRPLAFVPYDDAWAPSGDPPSYRGLYIQSLQTFADRVEAAAIPVERITGEVLLSAGGDDRVWPSDSFAAEIAARRRAHGLATETVLVPGAGHRVTLPGEAAAGGGAAIARGGSPDADATLGAEVWNRLCALLRLRAPR
jgi:dienelactone hydrolase